MTVIEIENNLNALVANFDKNLYVIIDALKNATAQNHLKTMKKDLNTSLKCINR